MFGRRETMGGRSEKVAEDQFDMSVMEWKEDFNYSGPFANSEKPGYQAIEIDNLLQFEEADVFDIPPVARATEIFGPLYSIDIDAVMTPHLIDYISGALTTVSCNGNMN
jgi:hypothetical protein